MKKLALFAVLFTFIASGAAHASATGPNGSTVSGTSGIVGAEVEKQDHQDMKDKVANDDAKDEAKSE